MSRKSLGIVEIYLGVLWLLMAILQVVLYIKDVDVYEYQIPRFIALF